MNSITKDFELKETEVAIAVDNDWSVSIYIPKTEEDACVPDHVLILTKIGVLLQDEKFINYVLNFPWPEGVSTNDFAADKRSGIEPKE